MNYMQRVDGENTKMKRQQGKSDTGATIIIKKREHKKEEDRNEESEGELKARREATSSKRLRESELDNATKGLETIKENNCYTKINYRKKTPKENNPVSRGWTHLQSNCA